LVHLVLALLPFGLIPDLVRIERLVASTAPTEERATCVGEDLEVDAVEIRMV
jgi:hypothetical protein